MNKKNYIYHTMSTIILISVFFLIYPLQASQQLINFQGRLTDQQGNPLDGTYDIIFSIYESDPNSGPLWSEIHTDISVSNGLVNVLLGSVTSFDEPQKVTFDQERYLGITIDCDQDPNTKEPEMTPRQRILPAIYSYNADRLDGRDSSEYTTPQTDAGRPGVAENLYEGNMRLVDKYLGKGAKAEDSDKLDGYNATTSGSANNAIPVINSNVTYNNLHTGYANSAGSVHWNNISGKPSNYNPSSHSHSRINCYWQTKTNESTHDGGTHWTRSFECRDGYFVAGVQEVQRATGDWWGHVVQVLCCKVQ